MVDRAVVDVREAPLSGLTVAITADRKGAELQTALHRLGARVVWGPTMRAVPPEVDDLLTAETRALLEADPTWFAISTGSGLRAWLAAAHRVGLGESVEQLLGRTRTVARGSKSHGALRAIGVDPVFVSAKETMDDVCSWLAGQVRADDVLGAQVHGGEVIATLDALRSRVSEVMTVSPYRWVLPSDLAAAQQVVQAIADGGVDVLAQTSAPSARNLFTVADAMGLREQVLGALRADVCVASVGPVTARAFEEVAVAVDVMPQRPRTADLLRSIVHWATARPGDPGAAPAGTRGG
ncbi:MAG: uroporphyrinogen-III synthase [Rhodoferax sp.]|nr:uroporphyrinogen-III synthase [Actinomycetota bacterium]